MPIGLENPEFPENDLGLGFNRFIPTTAKGGYHTLLPFLRNFFLSEVSKFASVHLFSIHFAFFCEKGANISCSVQKLYAVYLRALGGLPFTPGISAYR